MRSVLYPRREIVDRALDIEHVAITARSQKATGFDLSVERLGTLHQARVHPRLRLFTPPSYRVETPLMAAPPDPGVATWPAPTVLPSGGPFLFVSGLGPEVRNDISRDLWFEIDITLRPVNKAEPPLVGGICFAGNPFLPYYITEQGLNSANFGLPREWRVTWRDDGGATGDDEGYIDRRTLHTVQMPWAHGGLHIMAIQPTRATRLTLRLGDLPRILLKSRDPNQALIPEKWGALVPYLAVFEYRERVRRGARMSGGLVAATQAPPDFARSYLPELAEPSAATTDITRYAGVAADFVALTPSAYAPFSAAAIFDQRREYRLSAPGTRGGTEEVFIANNGDTGSQVRLVLAQSECFTRSMAGLRLAPIGPKPPPALTDALAPFDIEIYEIETLGGASPVRAAVRDPAENKYAVKLYSGSLTDPADNTPLTCAFDRPSNSTYLVVVLTAREKGHIGLRELSLVRSAHVALVPRPARRILVDAVNLRLIAPGLADDYATIGPRALGLSVERRAGGSRREVLFQAQTLLDLLDRGHARLHRNQRFWEVEREVARTHSRATGWRRSELGDGVGFTRPNSERGHADDRWPGFGQPRDPGFAAIGNSEQRSHLAQVGPEGLASSDQLRADLTNLNNIIGTVSGPTAPGFMAIPGATTHRLTDGFEDVWRGMDLAALRVIRGLRNLNLPPFSQAVMAIAQLISSMNGNNPANPTAQPGLLVDEAWRLALGACLSGGSVSFGMSGAFYFGVNGSISLGQAVPMASRTISKGDTGTVQLQGSRAGYQLRQNLSDAYDDGTSVRRIIERDRRRQRGAEVRWQNAYADVLTARIPINQELSASGGSFYQSTDQEIIVRIANDTDPELELDVWVDVTEEEIRDDH